MQCPLLMRAMAQTTATGRVDFQERCRLPLGEVQLVAGQLEEARTLAEEALAHARAHQEWGHEAYALRLLGDIAARHEPSERAQAELATAIELYRAMDMTFWLPETEAALVSCLQQCGSMAPLDLHPLQPSCPHSLTGSAPEDAVHHHPPLPPSSECLLPHHRSSLLM